MIAALTGRSYALLSVRIRSRGGTAFFLDKCFGTAIGGPLNVLLWLSYFVMLGLYAVAFGSYGAALLGFDPGGPWRHVLASGVVLAFVQGDRVSPAHYPSMGVVAYAGALIWGTRALS